MHYFVCFWLLGGSWKSDLSGGWGCICIWSELGGSQERFFFYRISCMCGGLILLDRSKACSGAACRNFCLAYYYAVYIGDVFFPFDIDNSGVEYIIFTHKRYLTSSLWVFGFTINSFFTRCHSALYTHSVLTLYLTSDLQHDAIDKSVSTSLHDVSNFCGEE